MMPNFQSQNQQSNPTFGQQTNRQSMITVGGNDNNVNDTTVFSNKLEHENLIKEINHGRITSHFSSDGLESKKSRNQSEQKSKMLNPNIICHTVTTLKDIHNDLKTKRRSGSKISIKSQKNNAPSNACLSITIKPQDKLVMKSRGDRTETCSQGEQSYKLARINTISNFFKDPSVISNSNTAYHSKFDNKSSPTNLKIKSAKMSTKLTPK